MMLKAESFSPYRCDRNVALGLNLTSLTKVLRAAQNEDILTIKAEDAPDVLNLVFESSESDRLSEYDLKLMDIDQEHLGIPDTEYAATISMSSSEFSRICRDLMALSESVSIEASKDGVKFSCSGDIGNGAVTLRSHSNVEKPEERRNRAHGACLLDFLPQMPRQLLQGRWAVEDCQTLPFKRSPSVGRIRSGWKQLPSVLLGS